MLVAAMNRLRAAYVAMDPSLKNHLMTGWTDDARGLNLTYSMGVRRSRLSFFLASAFVFLGSVNVIVAAGLGAVLANAVGAGGPAPTLLGVAFAALYARLVVYPAHKGYREAHLG